MHGGTYVDNPPSVTALLGKYLPLVYCCKEHVISSQRGGIKQGGETVTGSTGQVTKP